MPYHVFFIAPSISIPNKRGKKVLCHDASFILIWFHKRRVRSKGEAMEGWEENYYERRPCRSRPFLFLNNDEPFFVQGH